MEEKGIKLSPSSLNLFVECPRCFWLKHNRGIGRPDSIFPSLPGGMDRVLKVYFDEYRGTDSLPPIIEGRLEGKLMNPLPKSFTYVDDELKAILSGKLDDALDFGDGTFAPLDHKTRGSAPAEDILWMYQLQMDAYDFLMEKNKYPTRQMAYLVYYYPTPGQLHEKFSFEVAIKPVNTNAEHAYKVFSDAVHLLRSSEMPASAKTCSFCAWAKVMNNLDE